MSAGLEQVELVLLAPAGELANWRKSSSYAWRVSPL
jgi:hypothetical protein